MTNKSNKFILKLVVDKKSTLCDFLSTKCDISKIKIKDALNKGAAVLHRTNSKGRRVRKAKFKLLPGDTIQFGYSEKILQSSPPPPKLVHEEFHYSVWGKPATMLTQGTQYGDHCSLLRHIEIYYKHQRDIKVVHRLDRDASDLILFAHTNLAAQNLSKLFSDYTVVKKYKATCFWNYGIVGDTFLFTDSIDDKKASTQVKIIAIDKKGDCCDVDITLHTGRKHQIRRHLSEHSHPIIGDVIYGSRASFNTHLQLKAYLLSFICPFSNTRVSFEL